MNSLFPFITFYTKPSGFSQYFEGYNNDTCLIWHDSCPDKYNVAQAEQQEQLILNMLGPNPLIVEIKFG